MTGARVVHKLTITNGRIGEPGEACNPARLYTPLVLRPEGGASVSILPPAQTTDQQPRRYARHWYVDSHDYPGYCAACSLPPANGRHVGRTT